MGLLETLRQRAAPRGGTAQVDCGALGVLTVEALSPADCARLAGDSRALLYAACRDLQRSGEALRSEGRLFRPDEIMEYLTQSEADAAARTVAELSGLSEIRLSPVQLSGADFSGIRLDPVQTGPPAGAAPPGHSGETGEIRLSSVQRGGAGLSENGQVSREFDPFGGDFAPEQISDRKSQAIGEMSAKGAQIVVPKSGEAPQGSGLAAEGGGYLHEIKSESGGSGSGYLHETESELRGRGRGPLHETESDLGGNRRPALHETESESEALLHEMKSELRKAVHEIKSELSQMLHETRSDLAEEAAQRLAEGLCRAGEVGEEGFR